MLNERVLKGLEPKDKNYKVADKDGLFVEVFKTGKKVFKFRSKSSAKDTERTIGVYPQMRLFEARSEAKRIEMELALEEGQEETMTFKKVADEWLAVYKTKVTYPVYKATSVRLFQIINPAMGDMALDEIKPKMLIDFLRQLDETTGTISRKVLSIFTNVFTFGIMNEYCTQNPAVGLVKALAVHRITPRSALIEWDKIGDLVRRIQGMADGSQMKDALLFIMYTFQRSAECIGAEWSEFNLAKREWRIPAERMKMGREHRVPLSNQVMAILERRAGCHERYVFPNTQRDSGTMSPSGVLKAIRGLGYSKDEMTVHGFRAIASTILNENGFRADIIEAQLSHESQGAVRRAYNRAMWWDERVSMIQWYADYLDELALGADCNTKLDS